MSSVIRKKVHKKFRLGGYTLKVEALDEVLAFLSHFEGAEDEALQLLLDELQDQSLKSSILDKEPVHRVVSQLLEAEAAADLDEIPNSISSSLSLRIIDAFIVPKFQYDPVKKVFNEHMGRIPIHGVASSKITLYRDRFLLLLQRLSRDPYFSRPVFDTEMSQYGSCEISPIQSLIGLTGRRWIMGVICQLEDGHFYLEDLTAAVEINLSNAKITTGFFSENTIVLAEGEMLVDGIFQVKTCGFPPLEDREKSIAAFPGIDFFGCGTLSKEETVSFFVLPH
ncbi:DNA-directed DNA polymerase [Bertholletia excelsa]